MKKDDITICGRLKYLIDEFLRADTSAKKSTFLAEVVSEAIELSITEPSERIRLIAALSSRILLNQADSIIPNDLLNKIWQQYAVERPEELQIKQLLQAAQLLYELERYKEAIDIFIRYLSTSDTSSSDEYFRCVILLAYSYEALARAENNLGHADLGLQNLDDAETKVLLNAEQKAEIMHAKGHLHIVRYLIAGTSSAVDRRQGIDYLYRASQANPAYLSCYTSVYSEVGDHLNTIYFSLNELSSQAYKTLTQIDADTVEMEILFYVAHSYSCIGEYDRALECFRAFALRMSALKRAEAYAHGELFIIKTILKRRMVHEFTRGEIEQLNRQLLSISFASRASSSVADEALRYELVLKFLALLLECREHSENDRRFNSLYHQSKTLIETLEETVPDLFARPIVSVISDTDSYPDTLTQWLNQSYTNQQIVAIHSDISKIPLQNFNCEMVVIALKDSRLSSNLVQKLAHEKFVICLTEYLDGYLLEDAAHFYQPQIGHDIEKILTVGTAFSLCKRFLIQNRYIFALSPCEESPALKYQMPRYDIQSSLEI